jgi:hypothetical protein
MLKSRFIFILLCAAAVCLAPALPARAAEAWLEGLSRSMAAEIDNTFANKISIEGKKPVSAGLYRFKDLSGRFETEAPVLRRLVHGALAKNGRFALVNLDAMDSAFDSLYPFRTLDELNQEQLQQYAQKAGVDYVFSAKIVTQDSRPVVQLFIYNVRKGVLLFTPMFPVNVTAPAPDPPPVAPVVPAPATATATVTATATKPVPANPVSPATATAEIAPATGARAFFNIQRGKFYYVQGVLPDSPIVDFEPVDLDPDPAPEIAFLNTDSMVIVKLQDATATEFWSNQYRKSFPRRGLAGTLWFRRSGNKPLLYVSMNTFPRSIVYLWSDENKTLDKLDNVDRYIAHLDDASGKRLVSEYGKGVISFSGKQTRLVAAGGAMESDAAFPAPVDYYSSCILRASDTSNELTVTALVDEYGSIKVYQGNSKLLADTENKFGSTLDCWNNPRTKSLYILGSTEKSQDDRIVIFRLVKKASGEYDIAKQWVSDAVSGAVTRAKFLDLDGDRLPEVLAVEESAEGKFRFFYTAPAWPEEEY